MFVFVSVLSQRTTIDNRIEADGAPDEADADEDSGGGDDVIDLPIARATVVTSRYTASSRELPVRSASHTAAAASSSPYDQHQQQRQPYQSPSPVTKPRSAGAAYPLYDERSSPRDASSSSPSTSLHTSMTSYFGTARSDITPISSAQSSSRASYQQQPSRADVTDADSLQCPKCQMSFKANDHLSLLEHINECVS